MTRKLNIIIKFIVKAFFFFAIAASFTHLIEAAYKGGLTGWEAWSVPFMIDGIAILGLVMRSEHFSKDTRKIGMRVQIGAGALSLAGNVYAAHNLAGAMHGVGIVVLFLLTEWLSDMIKPVSHDPDIAAAEKRKAAVAKGAATRRRNAMAAKRVIKGAEAILAQS